MDSETRDILENCNSYSRIYKMKFDFMTSDTGDIPYSRSRSRSIKRSGISKINRRAKNFTCGSQKALKSIKISRHKRSKSMHPLPNIPILNSKFKSFLNTENRTRQHHRILSMKSSSTHNQILHSSQPVLSHMRSQSTFQRRLHKNSSLKSQLNERGYTYTYGSDGFNVRDLSPGSLMKRDWISSTMVTDFYKWSVFMNSIPFTNIWYIVNPKKCPSTIHPMTLSVPKVTTPIIPIISKISLKLQVHIINIRIIIIICIESHRHKHCEVENTPER